MEFSDEDEMKSKEAEVGRERLKSVAVSEKDILLKHYLLVCVLAKHSCE